MTKKFEEDENIDNSSTGGFDAETNLFNVIDEDESEEDNDEDDAFYNKSFEEFANEANVHDDDEDDENQNKVSFDENENIDDDDKEDEDLNDKDLELFNKKLGTDFKSVEDLKKNFNSDEKRSELEKENTEYSILSNRITLFDKYIGMNNETLVRNQLISQAATAKKDINNQDVLDEIEEKISGLNDLEQLDSFAETLRSNLQTQKDKTQNSIDKIDDKRIETEEKIARKNTDDLQNALSDIFIKKEFLGISVTEKDIQDVYKDIRNDKFFERINNNQEMIAKFAMFVKYEEKISKLANRPTQSDNTKSAFNFLEGNSRKQRRSITQASGSASSENAKNNLNDWLK